MPRRCLGYLHLHPVVSVTSESAGAPDDGFLQRLDAARACRAIRAKPVRGAIGSEEGIASIRQRGTADDVGDVIAEAGERSIELCSRAEYKGSAVCADLCVTVTTAVG